jgi:trehalose synthase
MQPTQDTGYPHPKSSSLIHSWEDKNKHMLIKSTFQQKLLSLEDYQSQIPKEQFDAIKTLAQKLKGLKVAHINATQYGGGAAEILQSLVPLMRGVGIDAEWYIIPQREEFLRVLLTKKLHNGLQGGSESLTAEEKESYIESSKILAEMTNDINPDIWVMHDPQALGSGSFLNNKGKGKLLRMHIDLSNPNKDLWNFLEPYMKNYDKMLVHMEEYVPKNFPEEKISVTPIAIDPLAQKNIKMDPQVAKAIVAKHGLNPEKPLLVNISRFDKLKDPIGMIDAFNTAKAQIPDLQFALVGLMIAADDPESVEVFEEVKQHSENMKDLFLFEDPGKLHVDISEFVRAFQSAADVVIHKSIYEGFGMVVTEAMIKGTPVIGGNVGGIKLQIKDGENGFLVNSADEAAQRIVQLIKDPVLRKTMGASAEQSVRARFLIPRLLLDYLKLFEEVLNK